MKRQTFYKAKKIIDKINMLNNLQSDFALDPITDNLDEKDHVTITITKRSFLDLHDHIKEQIEFNEEELAKL